MSQRVEAGTRLGRIWRLRPCLQSFSVGRRWGPDAGPVRFVTAATLFDGHDAAINMMRRLLQAQGAEVVHLGHNRSVEEIVRGRHPGGRAGDRDLVVPGRARRVLPLHDRHAARAGRRTRPRLRRRRRHHPAGGDRGARGLRRERIYHPEGRLRARPERHDRRRASRSAEPCRTSAPSERARRRRQPRRSRSRDDGRHRPRRDGDRAGELPGASAGAACARVQHATAAPVVGITGTGGAGKSSVVDELRAALPRRRSRRCDRACSRSTRPAGAPAARCSATASA